MGVDLYSLDFLLKFKGRNLGRTLMLGRQGFHIEPGDENALSLLRKRGLPPDLEELRGPTGFCEHLFKFLGATEVTSLDYSPFEGAEIVLDLNDPVPADLIGQFDTIFDGGTLEHVFNFPVAIQNVKSMLRPGGIFLAATVANNWLGHGFYQFSPELMWRVFSAESGFFVELMQLVEVIGMPEPINAPDPAKLHRRVEIQTTRAPTYLMVAATKLRNVSLPPTALQSDYDAAWQQHGGSSQG